MHLPTGFRQLGFNLKVGFGDKAGLRWRRCCLQDIYGEGVGGSPLRKYGGARGGIQNRYSQTAEYLRPDGLKHMSIAVWPEFHKAVKQYVADGHTCDHRCGCQTDEKGGLLARSHSGR